MSTKYNQFIWPSGRITIIAATLKGVVASRLGCFKLLSILTLGFGLLTAPLRAQFLYTANFNDSTVSAFSIGSNGALTPVPGSPFPSGGVEPTSVAIDPEGLFAYIANSSDDRIAAYSIGANGALTSIGKPISNRKGVSYAVVSPNGQFLYVLGNGHDKVSAYSIDSNGALTLVPGSPFPTGKGPDSIAVDPTGNFAFIANYDGNSISAYDIDSNGVLTPIDTVKAGKEPDSVAVDPGGQFVYVANVESETVSAYSIAPSGLTPVPGSPFKIRGAPAVVVVDATGSFVYVAYYSTREGGVTEVSAYSIASNGALSAVPGSPFEVGTSSPTAMAADPTGQFLYLAYDGVYLAGFSIGSNGALTLVPGSPFITGDFPLSVAITQ